MDNKVSLIIPVENEENSISVLLESLKEQSRLPEEVIITDGGSKDRTVEIIESYIVANSRYPMRLIKVAHAYPGRARNLAIECSRYNLIAMTDAGIRLNKNWLKGLLDAFEKYKEADVIYGDYQPVLDSFFRKCLATVFVPARRVINGKIARSHFIASCLMKKRVWESVGGFPDFRAAEDRIFMEKIKEKGFKVGFAPEATVYWNIPSDFKTTFKRFVLYSIHDIEAGRFRDWHYPVMRLYIAGLVLILSGILFSPFWFFVLGIGILARALTLIFEKAKDESLSNKLNIKRIALVGIIMIWIDIAMFIGTARFMVKK